MKQTFYVQEYIGGNFVFFNKQDLGAGTPIGTIELDVQPIKKEVEKVRDVIIASTSNDGEKMISAMWIPGGAYDVKVSYKIKE